MILRIVSIFLLLNFIKLKGQEKTFFNKTGKVCAEAEAFYYRTKTTGNTHKSYYVNGNALFFEGLITTANNSNEELNIYADKCIWYFKNGNKKQIKKFNSNGLEEGTSQFYYESGKICKEVEMRNGKTASSKYTEYDEDGNKSTIFSDDFDNNTNDWDVYTSDKSMATIEDGKFKLTSLTVNGSARYINFGAIGDNSVIEAVINTENLKADTKAGLIYGFKNWDNYNFFLISGTSMYIGFVYEGITQLNTEGMYASSIIKNGTNNLKVLVTSQKVIFSINGELQYTKDEVKNYGNNLGFLVTGKSSITVDKLTLKNSNLDNTNTTISKTDEDIKSTGSGIFVSKNGYIVTNYHVINDAKKIVIETTTNNLVQQFNAKLIQQDKDNDLAILKITDENFKGLENINYIFKPIGGVDVGASVFTMGFPLALSGMGKEAKYTDGKVSSKTGYDGAINSFQTSIPVQPGNSGGPVFNTDGDLVGLINASVNNTDNVSYAIKLNYIKNLIEVIGDIETPTASNLKTLSNEEKIKIISNYVVLIKIK